MGKELVLRKTKFGNYVGSDVDKLLVVHEQLKEKLSDYEQKIEAIAQAMIDANVQAELIVSKAGEEADQLRLQGEMDAYQKKQMVSQEVNKLENERERIKEENAAIKRHLEEENELLKDKMTQQMKALLAMIGENPDIHQSQTGNRSVKFSDQKDITTDEKIKVVIPSVRKEDESVPVMKIKKA